MVEITEQKKLSEGKIMSEKIEKNDKAFKLFLSNIPADEKAEIFINFVKRNYLNHLPQTHLNTINQYENMKLIVDSLAPDISYELKLELSHTFRSININTHAQLFPKRNYKRWLVLAKNDANYKAKEQKPAKQLELDQRFTPKEVVMERLFSESCPITLCKLIGEEEDAIIRYISGKTVIKEKDLEKLAMTPQGNIYSRPAIIKALLKKESEPLTRITLKVDELIPLNSRNVDIILLNQHFALLSLKKGIDEAKVVVEKASPQLENASEEEKVAYQELKDGLEEQSKEVEELLKAKEIKTSAYSDVAKKTLALVKDNPMSKKLEDYESTVVGAIESVINFFLVKCFSREPISFFDHPTHSVARKVNKTIENFVRLT